MKIDLSNWLGQEKEVNHKAEYLKVYTREIPMVQHLADLK